MSLTRAMKAFVSSQCDRSRMNVPAWAETYHCGVEDVRKAWEDEMSIASRKPTNCFDEGGEGK